MLTINYNNYLLRKTTKTPEDNIKLDKSLSLLELIELLGKKYGPDFRSIVMDMETVKLKLPVLVNGIRVNDLKCKIKDKDKINIISLISGG